MGAVLVMALVGSGLPASTGVDAAEGQGTLTLSVTLGSQVAGGMWSLTAPTETDEGVGLRLLDDGAVPDDGKLVVSVPDLPERALAADETTFLHLSVSRPVDDQSAWVSAASIGLLGTEVAAGRAHALQAVAPQLVPVRIGRVEVVPVPLDRQRSVEPSNDPAPAPAPGPGTPAEAPVRGAPRPQRRVASSQSAAVTDIPSADPDTSGQGLVPQRVVPAGCNFAGVCERVKASKLIPGVRAFRWFSSQSLGTRATFQVKNSFAQEWENGFRAGGKAGPFEVSGHSTRTKSKEGGIVDTGPTRADCWTPVQTGDGPGCGTNQQTEHGFVPVWGRDTWQWQKVEVTASSCFDFGCRPYTYTEERLRNYQYDGGTEFDPVQRRGFGERPSEVRAGRWGSFAELPPGAQVAVSTETSVTKAQGATIKLEFSSEEGAANGSFTSTSKQKQVDKIEDVISARNQVELPFLTNRLRYDGRREKWEYVYWTCENEDGWTGGACWEHGS
ncbi:MAG: hypothetical protein ACRDV9_01655 [Acidimicrobiia bacterium]